MYEPVDKNLNIPQCRQVMYEPIDKAPLQFPNIFSPAGLLPLVSLYPHFYFLCVPIIPTGPSVILHS